MTRTERTGGVTALAVAFVLIIVMAYVGGYLFLGSEWRPGPGPGPHRIRMRVFPSPWLATVYQPAAWVESRCRGYHIASGDDEALFMSSP